MSMLRTLIVLGAALVSALAGASPPLLIPHGRLGQVGIDGPSTVWQGEDGARFIIQTGGDIPNAVGTVSRRAMEIGEDGTVTYAPQSTWEAGALLASGNTRNIFSSAGTAFPFAWDSLPPAVRAQMEQASPSAAADGLGEARVGFLRGDRSREAGQPNGVFRQRRGILGDVVNSVPLVVGPPLATGAGSGYARFREQFKKRSVAVYVGANDGMLHAFSAASGAELFSYIPAALTQHLPALASMTYMGRPYVDGSPGHGDVQINASWRSVLASGMGMGARGVYALDITDPANFSQGMRALWEFTEADDPAMGHVREPPLIAKISQGEGAQARHFAVVASGINNLAPDGSGALFLLALDKLATAKWQKGANYFGIATGAGDASQPNALAPPALVVGPDGSATRAYAGDLQGNLWRFDFNTMAAHLLFAARDQSGAAQPITHAPKVVFAPGGGYLVLFATGKLLEEGDLLPASFRQQSLYAVLDARGAPAKKVLDRTDLAMRSLSANGSDYAIRGSGFDFFGPEARSGWYFDFPNARADGERAAGAALSIAGAIAITTFLPPTEKSVQASSRLYVLDPLTGFAYVGPGTAASNGSTGELAPFSPTLPLIVTQSASVTGENNATGGVVATRKVTLVRINPKGSGQRAITIDVRYRAGRLGWREVANWQELHHAAIRNRR